MGRANTLSSLFWLALAIYVAAESYRLGLGNWEIPGVGYFSFGGAFLLGVMSLIVLVDSLRKPLEKKETPPPREALRRQNVILVLAAMVGYALFLNKIGFVLCTFLLMLFLSRWVAVQAWVRSLVVAFLVTLGSYLLFEVFLKAQLPPGIFNL